MSPHSSATRIAFVLFFLGLPAPAAPQHYDLRIRNHKWTVGTVENPQKTWTPISPETTLIPNFFNGANSVPLAQHGQGLAGRTAHVVFYPDLPRGATWSADPEDTIPSERYELSFPNLGQIFLAKSTYSVLEEKIHGLSVSIYSEASNPAREIAIHTLTRFSELFPNRTISMSKQGKVSVILIENKTESFEKAPLEGANGLHNVENLMAIQYTEDGTSPRTRVHAYHEIGGLFRLPDKDYRYAHGLTWMVAYDLLEKDAKTPAEKKFRECADLKLAIWSIRQTAIHGTKKDFSHSIEYYIDDVDGHDGYPMYAWGSSYYWKKINRELEPRYPALYPLIDSIHAHIAAGSAPLVAANDLDRLIAAYRRMSPEGAPLFEALTLRYFRYLSLGDLIDEALADYSTKDCDAVLK